MKRPILFALLVGLILILPGCSSYTEPIKNASGQIDPNGIASLEQTRLGGMQQWLLIRGANQVNPILLFLHGGPGSPYMGLSHAFQQELEKHFVVVQWDQRGSGKSLPNTPKQSMTVKQFQADTHELVLQLKDRFQRKKIFLLGHSWGAYLGLAEAKKHPENIYAYIGTGQMIDLIKQEQLSHQFVLERAKAESNNKAINELIEIGTPPYRQIVNGMETKYSWLWHYGGMIEGETGPAPFVKALIKSKEYSLLDINKFVSGMSFSLQNLADNEGENFWQLKAPAPDLEFNCPIYFVTGEHDYVTPASLIEKYANELRAPEKQSFIIKQAGHFAFFTNPHEFSNIVNEIRNRTLPQADSVMAAE